MSVRQGAARCALCVLAAGLWTALVDLSVADVQIVLPLGRTAYQTNEWIDLAVVRKSPTPLGAGSLRLQVVGDDGSRLTFAFPVAAAPAEDGDARATEHLHLNAWLLRPGHYMLEAALGDEQAKTEIDLYSHVRRSSFRLINWARAKGADQLCEGEDGMGFNLFYGQHAPEDGSHLIRAGIDFMACCAMSGGHQMDLRSECDWSDPYVVRGGTRRVVARALADRTQPNVLGVHFYDEPGLTWSKDPKTGEMTPHTVPWQHRSYRSAFGRDAIPYFVVRPDNPEQVAQWRQWSLWKLGFIDAAWKDAQFGVSYVRPDYLSVTQSQYGFSAFADGYYFNVARSLPIVSGHGGYDDYGAGYFNPSYFLEVARARDLLKPCWYLPTWYGNTPSERFRLEQNLSFMTNIQGMISPPDIDPFQPATKPAAEGVVESNKLMARLGPIFTTMPVTRPPVAMLYSMSENLLAQTADMKANYAHHNKQGLHLPFTYLAGKMIQQQFLPVVDEDVVDGTLAAQHRAIVITSVDYLEPNVVNALEQFAESGGLVLLTADCKVAIRGGVNLGVTPELPDAEQFKRLQAEGKYAESNRYATVSKLYEGAKPLAQAIKAKLDLAGIKPPVTSDQPGIAVTRQAEGDLEYLFVVNATHDPAPGGVNDIRTAAATLGFPADGRPIYDAVRGGLVPGLENHGGTLSGQFRFGPGQMRVFARSSRPLGKIQVLPPLMRCDYTKAEMPRSLDIAAVLLDDQGRLLSGSAPLEIEVVDPLGRRRYDLFCATRQGSLQLSLPLAANDRAGQWKLTVSTDLAPVADSVVFKVTTPNQCAAVAGATPRAVAFGNERDNVFRFFRVHQDVTLVLGSSPSNRPAAERLTEILRPWGVRCKTVNAADVNRPRTLTEDEARTWVGLEFGRAKPGKDNSTSKAGFDLDGPVVLLGTPADNPLIQFLQKERFLPYAPSAEFPGRGRGMIAWQRDGIGAGQESITLIAYDAAGMAEAVGTLYEFAAGIEPLTRFTLPVLNSVKPADQPEMARASAVVGSPVVLPDRALALKVGGDGRLQVLTWDGSLSQIDVEGKVVAQTLVAFEEITKRANELKPPADPQALEMAKKKAPPGRIVKAAVRDGQSTAVAYWGGQLDILDSEGNLLTRQQLSQDIAALAWHAGRLVVALADGRIVFLAGK